MPQLILHHHDPSPFAEKIRLVMGVKGLAWASVQIPMIMPKPDLTALTGGYRKTPVLQIGADVYCDTALIARELERRYPAPTLFPHGMTGLGYALGQWSDKTFFQPGAGLSMGENKDIPEPVLEDRKAFFNLVRKSAPSPNGEGAMRPRGIIPRSRRGPPRSAGSCGTSRRRRSSRGSRCPRSRRPQS